MSYSGATAASSIANPPVRLAGYIGGGANSTAHGNAAGKGVKSLWMYGTSDEATNLRDSNYFTDGWYLGMRSGDIMIYTCSTGSSISVGVGVVSSAASTAGCALGSTGGVLSSTR